MKTNNVGKMPFKQVNGSKKMEELWINTGSRCNLACIHCYVDSSPKNDFLNQLTLSDIEDDLKTARDRGVEHIYFTGGEPFINRNIIPMIGAGLGIAATTVLTNGTRPLRKHIPALMELKERSAHELFLRVSLDHYQAARHDLIRGKGKFSETMETIRQLHDAGFRNFIITPTAEASRGTAMTEEQIKRVYRDIFRKEGIPVDVKVIVSILEMGAQVRRTGGKHEFVRITQSEISEMPEEQLPMCHNGRSLQKVGGEKMILPCPVLYNPEFSMGGDLAQSLESAVPLRHTECYHYCMKNSGMCGN